MTPYTLLARTKEWTSWIGIFIAGLGGALPMLVGSNEWTAGLTSLLPAVGAAMFFIPQTPAVQAGENVVLTALKLLDADIPPSYQSALQPILLALAAKLQPPASAGVVTQTIAASTTASAVAPAAPQVSAAAAAPAAPAAAAGAAAPVFALLLGLGLMLSACAQTTSTASTTPAATPAQQALVAVEAGYTALATAETSCIVSGACNAAVATDIKAADAIAYPAIVTFRKAVESGATLTAASLAPIVPALQTMAADLTNAGALSAASSAQLNAGITLLGTFISTLGA